MCRFYARYREIIDFISCNDGSICFSYQVRDMTNYCNIFNLFDGESISAQLYSSFG
ncbi:MAG: hypothetical protein ACI8RL_002163 [Cyclobacteriaceae bacterium]|jgi:hypothetical protein